MYALRRFPPVVITLFVVIPACQPHAPNPVDLSRSLDRQLVRLESAIGDSRIVLLGENGHGVGSISEAKSDLVAWLHERLGFEVVAFESGYFECGRLDAVEAYSARSALFDCLRYPFQHEELLPVFRLVGETRARERRLALAGIDIQAQGFDSGPRPSWASDRLMEVDEALAREVARLDTLLYLVEAEGGLGDGIYEWAAENGDSAIAVYRAAARSTQGWARGVFRLAEGWIRRLQTRGEAERGGAGVVPTRYYELRDEWMADAVAYLADSVHVGKKLVVWLHNDHARYGSFEAGEGLSRSVGGYLADRYGAEVFSMGIFMGEGEVADNSRRLRPTEPLAPDGLEAFLDSNGSSGSFLVLRGKTSKSIVEWAGRSRAYMRTGYQAREMVPAREFDALFFVRQARPPDYDIPEQ